MCLKETEARPREPSAAVAGIGGGPQPAAVPDGLQQALQQATQELLAATSEVMLQAAASGQPTETAAEQEQGEEPLTNGFDGNCSQESVEDVIPNNALTENECIVKDATAAITRNECIVKDATAAITRNECIVKDATAAITRNECIVKDATAAITRNECIVKDTTTVFTRNECLVNDATTALTNNECIVNDSPTALTGNECIIKDVTAPAVVRKCENEDNSTKVPSSDCCPEAQQQQQPRKRVIKKTRTKMLPSFGQPYTFCIGLKNKRSESIDDGAAEGGGGGGGRNVNTDPSSAALNGITEVMNGNVDTTESASLITTNATTTTTTTNHTADRPRLTNGVSEVTQEQKQCSEKENSRQLVITKDSIEVISEETKSVNTSSESVATVSLTSEISNTESTQVITTKQVESKTTETKHSENTTNVESKIINSKIKKNDPPKTNIEVKKSNPFDDIRMGLKSVKKTPPKSIPPKPTDNESNELNELFKRTGSLKRNKTPLRNKENIKKDENDTGSRRGSLKGKLPPKKLSDASMKSEDEKDSSDSVSRKGSLKGKLPKKSSEATKGTDENKERSKSKSPKDTAKSVDEKKERTKSKSPKKTSKKKTEDLAEKKDSSKTEGESKEKESNSSSLPNGTVSSASAAENGLSNKAPDIQSSQLPDKESKDRQSPSKSKDSENKEKENTSKMRSSESKERSPSLRKKSKSKSPSKSTSKSPSKSPSKSTSKLDSSNVQSKNINSRLSEARTSSEDKSVNVEVGSAVNNKSNSIKDVRWASEESTNIPDVGISENNKSESVTSVQDNVSQSRTRDSASPSVLETTVDRKEVSNSEITLEEKRFSEASGSSPAKDGSDSLRLISEGASGSSSISISSKDAASGSSSSSSSSRADVAESALSSGATKGTSSSCLDEEEELSGISIFVIVRDMSASSALVNKITIMTGAKSTCGELMQEVARRFKYEADSFSLILQRSNGEQVEVERLESERTLEHGGFQVEDTPRNNLILCDLGGQPPRRTDDDDLSLGASASPTANATEKKWFDRSNNQENSSSAASATQDMSYSQAVIKHDTGYVGLVNQAMTCYLNSLLQTLFMTPEFRNALYHWEFKGTEEEASKNIPCQIQRLFLLLQTANRSSIETTNLTKSFGWDSSEAWQQHDIQELCRVMFDALERCFKNTDQSDLIKNLYEGKMKDYVKCLECENERAREDAYLDVPLPIRPFGATNAYKSVEEALRSFVEPEVLSGSNQYKCSNCDTLCDAHKGLKFTRFPYLLTIHLMRFDFDYNTLHRIKLNDKVTFPNILDLNSFVDDPSKSLSNDSDKVDAASTADSGSALDAEESSVENASTSHADSDNQDEDDEGIDVSTFNNERNKACLMGNGPSVYELFSIMIHSGSASGGHYYAYIKDFVTGEWFCFNDQSVTRITFDDIRKTYGGGNSRSYYSSWSSSANAYMLMYRQVNKEKNVSAFTKDELPNHIKNLVERMNNEEAAEREAREMERCMCHIKLFCQHPKQNQMVEKKLHVHKDTTLSETIKMSYDEMGLSGIVPLEQCRLVKYEEFHDSLEASYEGQEEECISEILGGVRSTYKFDLLLEIRDKDKQFEVYKTGGTTVKVHIVNLSTEEVEGPFTLRASLTMTVKEFKDMLGRTCNQNSDSMRVVLERYYNDLRPLTNDDKTLKMEGFYRSNKIYIESSGEEQSDFFTGSQMFRILDRFENTITLFCSLPDASAEALKELQIPAYIESECEVTSLTSESSSSSIAPSSSAVATLSAAASFEAASSPAESAASPASCSSKDSGISSKGIETSGSEISSSSSSNAQSPSTSVAATTAVVTVTTAAVAATALTGTGETTTQTSDVSSNNGSDGEDEGIADAEDSATGGSNVNSDQSASEDSSLTSDSDRTLVGDPPEEDKLSDASNSPGYRNVSSPEENSRDTKDTEGGWGDDDKEQEIKRYCRANYFTEDSTNQEMLRVSVDKRITIGLLKTNMQLWVGVSTEHFKIFKIYSSSQEFECTRMTETLASYGDNTRLSVRLGRALLPGEQRGKVYLLEPQNSEDPAKFLIDWVICNGDSVANAKKAIIREVNSRCNMSLTPELVRLRKKSWKNPQTIYLENQLFDDDIPFYSNWELFLQVLDGPETRSASQEELAIFVKRWCPSNFTTVQLTEIIIPKATSEDLKKKLSELSGIASENIEFTKGKGTFPCDMSVLDINNDLDWTPREGPLDQRPLYILDDGAMIYYRDKTESLKNLSEDERRDLTSSENKRLNRDLGYSCSSTTTSNYSTLRSKEKGLKIYLDHEN